MDIDPPAPKSSTAKKTKFKPKAPPRREKAAPVLLTTEGNDDDDDDDDAAAAEIAKDLLRKVSERRATLRPRVEKKCNPNVNRFALHDCNQTLKTGQQKPRECRFCNFDFASSDNREGSSSTHNQLKDGSSKNITNLKNLSEKSVVISSSTATKDDDIDEMLVDDEFGSSSDSDNEYKDPWDPNSYYPISLPLRPPGSADPEVLNAQEFLEGEDEYDETKVNSAFELGLLDQENNEKKQMIFFQFPDKLPFDKQTNRIPVSSKGKEKIESSGLKDLPAGYMGKMLVYKSGAIKFKLGDTTFNVNSGTAHGCMQDVAVMNTKTKNCCVLGPTVDKPAVVTPDLDSILGNINLGQ